MQLLIWTSLLENQKYNAKIGKIVPENFVSFLADACFKAASIAVRDFPATLEIDGCEINTEPLLVSYIKQMLSILLIVPVQ